jgi:hypothetical protein
VLLGAAICPHPPLLHPVVGSGGQPLLDELRDACRLAVAELVALRPGRIMVVGDAARPFRRGTPAAGSLAPYGVDVRLGDAHATPDLPLAHTLGCWLLDGAG